MMRVLSAIGRRAAHRTRFASHGDWLLTFYDSLLRFNKRLPLPGRERLVGVRLATMQHAPILMRLGRADGFVMEEIFLTRVYAPVIDSDLGEMKTIVDLGANVGYSVRLWLHQYPHAQVVAVEPDDENLAVCQRNVEASGAADHVHLIQAFVAAHAGNAYLDRTGVDCAFSMTDRPTGNAIEAITMDALLARTNIAGQIDLLKCDIEGTEKELFRDCRAWIGRVRNLMIELHPGYDLDRLLADLGNNGSPLRPVWKGETADNPLVLLRSGDGSAPAVSSPLHAAAS